MNDYLAQLLRRSDLGPSVLLTGAALALAAGAVHALSPGHGKTIVAAYLVGARGTFRHALLLGAAVTITHTFSVFLIGLGTLFVSAYVVPQKIIPALGAISGLSIVIIGAWLFVQRLNKLRGKSIHHHHHHGHDHDHPHGPHTHTHTPEGDVTVGSLIVLGASGGLVPCPTAMVLMLSAIALGHTATGLLLLVAFSIGLAGVLVAIGGAVLYAKHWLPDAEATTQRPLFRLIPVLSAAIITVVGMLMTAASLGWLPFPVG